MQFKSKQQKKTKTLKNNNKKIFFTRRNKPTTNIDKKVETDVLHKKDNKLVDFTL